MVAENFASHRIQSREVSPLFWKLVGVFSQDVYDYRYALAEVVLARTIKDIEANSADRVHSHLSLEGIELIATQQAHSTLGEFQDQEQKQHRKHLLLKRLGSSELSQTNRYRQLKELLYSYFSSAQCLNSKRWTLQTIERVGFSIADGEMPPKSTGEGVFRFALEVAERFRTISGIVEKQQFDTLLMRLHPDHQQAGQEYEKLRDRLIYFFESRQWHGTESGQFLDVSKAADETLNRVSEKLYQEVECNYPSEERIQNMKAYSLGVARLVWLELHHQLTQSPPQPPLPPPSPTLLKQLQAQCLKSLKEEQRKLIIQYYGCKVLDERNAAEYRRQLVEEFGFKDLKALQQSISYIRSKLEKCVEQRLRLARNDPDEGLQLEEEGYSDATLEI